MFKIVSHVLHISQFFMSTRLLIWLIWYRW